MCNFCPKRFPPLSYTERVASEILTEKHIVFSWRLPMPRHSIKDGIATDYINQLMIQNGN